MARNLSTDGPESALTPLLERARTLPRPWSIATAVTLAALLVLAWEPAPSTDVWPIAAILGVLAVALEILPVPLPNAARPLHLTALAVLPVWLAAGAGAAGVVALAAVLLTSVLDPGRRGTLIWDCLEAAAGVTLGALVGDLGQAIAWEALAEPFRGAGFLLGAWAARVGMDELARPAPRPRVSRLLELLAAGVLFTPGLILAQIARDGDPLATAGAAVLTVVIVVLARLYVEGQTRTFELETEASTAAAERHDLELILDRSPEAMVGVSLDGTVQWANRTATQWLGEPTRRTSGSIGEFLRVSAPGEGSPLDHRALLRAAARSGRPQHQEGVLHGERGAPERVLVSYSAPADGGDQALIIVQDGATAAGGGDADELAVHLSHELRAPLTTILGYAELLSRRAKGDRAPEAWPDYVRRISDSGDYMLRLVNNLLDLGRLDRGAERLDLSTVEVVGLTREVIVAHQPLAAARAQTLRLAISQPTLVARTNDLALRQVLTNLVSNAIKYTPPEGRVNVEIQSEPGWVAWRISDTGIGLSPDEQLRLFTRFFRSERPEARLTKGTGLGLALTRELVERLKGTIEVESAIDRGSTFTVRLPNQATNA